ncbi:MAG: hypothetical protein JKX69_11240, partial [Rhodobacteraceae bacterium]|nr:hypothetical protein [Paracoccaceae bacterium]
MSDSHAKKPASLTDADIKTCRGLGRRSFLLGAFGGATALSACVETSGGAVTTGITDSDSGAYADAVGNGSGGRYTTGITDSDTGAYADPAGNGDNPYT